jgi:hypothetical protein
MSFICWNGATLIGPSQKNHDAFNNSIIYQDGTMVILPYRHLYIIQEQTCKLKTISYNGIWDKYDGDISYTRTQEQMWIMMGCFIYDVIPRTILIAFYFQ